MKKLIGPFAEIVTLDHLPFRGALHDDQLEIIRDAAVVVEDGMIIHIDQWDRLSSEFENKQIEEIHTPSVLLPGWIDSHTHICYGGSRQQDYAMRIAGMTYLAIAKAGGGIWDTVQKTRSASKTELIKGIKNRVTKQIAQGITTCEVKSGYGLSVAEEIKMLEAIQDANSSTAIDLIPTCLAAHMLPKDYNGSGNEYLNMITHDLLPILKEKELSNRIDIFIEDGAFSTNDAIHYLSNAKFIGFDITVHGDQFSTGGSAIAIEVGAVSVDHLEASGSKEIQLIAKSNTIATALPGASIGLGCAFTPARALLDHGAAVAIASDWNPGSAPMGDLLTQASILSTFEKLSTAETLAGMTYRAAAALNLSDRGIIRTGMKADFIAFSTNDYRDILYHQGQLKPSITWKNGINIYTDHIPMTIDYDRLLK